MTWLVCDGCGKDMKGIDKIANSIHGDRDGFYESCKDAIRKMNPHKSRIRRFLWTSPKLPANITTYDLDFCSERCYKHWKDVVDKKCDGVIARLNEQMKNEGKR